MIRRGNFENKKKNKALGSFFLAVTASLAWLVLIYTMQNPDVIVNLASIGWNRLVLP